MTFCVTIPTRNRPVKLRGCLEALRASTGVPTFEIIVCDSSDDPATRQAVADVVDDFAGARLVHHDGWNAAMARNTATRSTDADLVVSVDDDVFVEPTAVAALVEAAQRQPGAMVAGTVRWGDEWSTPVKMRAIGYGRPAGRDEDGDFLVSAFVAYPRELNLRLPWNEHLRREEDRCFGSLLRSHGIPLVFEPRARAIHHDEHNTTGPQDIGDHIYANLFEAVVVRRRPALALSYLFIGFAFSVRAFGLRTLTTTMSSWVRGVGRFVADLPHLRSVAGHGERQYGSRSAHLSSEGG